MAGFTLPLVNPSLGAPPETPGTGTMPNMRFTPIVAPPAAPSTVMLPSADMPVKTPVTPTRPEAPTGVKAVLQQLLPVLISGIAAKRGGPMAGSAVLQGYAQGLAQKHQQALEQQQMMAKLDASNLEAQQKAAQLDQDKRYKLSQFIENITKQVNDIDDSATFAATVDLADKTAQQAFGSAPGMIKNALVFNDAKRLDKEKKAAKETVDAFLKAHPGVTLDQALSANVMIGSKKLSDIAALANYEPARLPSGELFQAESPVTAVTSEKDVATQAVSEARKAARMAGKPFTQTDATRVSQQAIKAFKEATRLSPQSDSPTVGGGGEVKTDSDLKGDMQDVLEGRNTMYNIRQTMGRSNSAATYMKKMRAMIRAVDPSFDFIASDAGGKSVSTSYVQRATAAINAVMPNIDRIIGLSDQVKRIGVRGVDELLQRGKVQFGNKAVANFRQAQKLIADEIGVALGAGTVSDMKLQLGFDVTDPAVTPEVFASNMELVKEFIQNRKKGLEELRYRSGKMPDYSQNIPQAVHEALDGQPNGHTYTLSDGSKWIKGADGSIKAGG